MVGGLTLKTPRVVLHLGAGRFAQRALPPRTCPPIPQVCGRVPASLPSRLGAGRWPLPLLRSSVLLTTRAAVVELESASVPARSLALPTTNRRPIRENCPALPPVPPPTPQPRSQLLALLPLSAVPRTESPA